MHASSCGWCVNGEYFKCKTGPVAYDSVVAYDTIVEKTYDLLNCFIVFYVQGP